MSFKAKMEEAAKSKNSPIVLALDFPYEAPENRSKVLVKAQKILKAVHPYICAVKINHHLVLPLGTFDGVAAACGANSGARVAGDYGC